MSSTALGATAQPTRQLRGGPTRNPDPSHGQQAAPDRIWASSLHPLAWWIWALGLAGAASRATNPLLLALMIAVAGLVVAARQTTAPRARTYRSFLVLGGVVVVIRTVSAVGLGTAAGSTVLLRLPELPLPAIFAGIRFGGPVTAETLVGGASAGLQLATLLCCVGAANALADPLRLLKVVPGALYEVAVAIVVAVTVAPQLAAEIGRVRLARRLRGRSGRGLRALGQTAVPVLHGALERSLALAASMDARGYGRRVQLRRGVRMTGAATGLGGLVAVLVGTYGLLAGGLAALDRASAGGPGFDGLASAVVVFVVGIVLLVIALVVGSRRSPRTRYRPQPWRATQSLVAGSGLLAAAALALVATEPALGAGALIATTVPLTAPGLPPLAAAGILVAALPAALRPR